MPVQPTDTVCQHLPGGALLARARASRTHGAAIGLTFIPPLIGDTAKGQLYRFRRLRHDGLSLYTFAYPGHPGAAGRFSLKAAVRTTRRHLSTASALARESGIPLFGVGCCAATIPLLAAIQAVREIPVRLVLLNPLVCFAPVTLAQTFWSYSRNIASAPLGRLRSLPVYLDHLFPEVPKNRDRFGALERRRVALLRLMTELIGDRLMAGVRVTGTPVLCCYGQADPLLQQLLPRGADSYEAAVRRHCPDSVFEPLPAAHFFAAPRLREHLRRLIREMFSSAGL